jgi:hypothetical protein
MLYVRYFYMFRRYTLSAYTLRFIRSEVIRQDVIRSVFIRSDVIRSDVIRRVIIRSVGESNQWFPWSCYTEPVVPLQLLHRTSDIPGAATQDRMY